MSVRDAISIQIYTLRSLGTLPAALDTIASAGYPRVELIGSHLCDAGTVRRELDARGLHASSSHVGMDQLRDESEAMIEACRILGIDELYMPAVPPAQRDMDAAGWKALGSELGHLAERFESARIRLGYHNHDWELAPKADGKTALELLFESAGSAPLVWQADIAWLVRGGADAKAWLQRHASIVGSAHVKDLAPTGENIEEDGWADVGSGVLDWVDLWKAARGAGAHWMVVEHDKPADPAACIKNAYDYLTKVQL